MAFVHFGIGSMTYAVMHGAQPMPNYRKVFSPDGTTRAYVDGVLVEGVEPTAVATPTFMADIEQHYGEPIISPIDKTVISSRSQLRAHNARHGVAQCGELNGQYEALQEKRMGFVRGSTTDRREFRWV